MSDLPELIRFLRRHGPTTACVYRGARRDGALVDSIHDGLGARMRVRVIGEEFLSSWEAMTRCPIGLLVIPELAAVPERAFQSLKHFLNRGGAMFVSSGDFSMSAENAKYTPPFESRQLHDDEYFRRTAAFLGAKPYQAAIVPRAAEIDTDFLPGIPPRIRQDLAPHGISWTTGSERFKPEPPYGHAFPERYPVRRIYRVIQGTDHLGSSLTTAALFSQDWETGARLAAVAFNGRGSILDPRIGLSAQFLAATAEFCAQRVMIASLDPGYACYRPGETVDFAVEVKSFDAAPVQCELGWEVTAEGERLSAGAESIEVRPGASVRVTKSGFLEDLPADEYTITSRLVVGGRVCSRATNAFVVWKNDTARRGPRIEVSGSGFSIDGKCAALTGTNYYESNIGELMWLRPDISALSADLRAMRAAGINYLRIHYHHPRWFFDYLHALHGEVPSWYTQRTEPLPDEQYLRIFDAHVYLCQKLGIVYGGDLFTLLPEALGDPRGWFGVHDYAWLEEKIAMQMRFIQLLIPRYVDVPGISWDLFNEPKGVDDALFTTWAARLRAGIRELGDRHPMTVGSEDPRRFEGVVDYFAEHRNFRMAGKVRIGGGKPEMLQEAWLDRPPTPEGDRAQRADMRAALLGAFGSGLNGFSPWQWTNQARLRSDIHAFEGEIWDDRLGCCARNDGTTKPAGSLYAAFSQLIAGVELRNFENGRFLTGAGELTFIPQRGERPLRGEFMIVHSGSKGLFAGLGFGEIVWDGKLIVRSVEDEEIWFSIPGGGAPPGIDQIFLRTSGTCRLFPCGARSSVHLALRRSLSDPADLFPVSAVEGSGGISIQMEDWFSSYWLHVAW